MGSVGIFPAGRMTTTCPFRGAADVGVPLRRRTTRHLTGGRRSPPAFADRRHPFDERRTRWGTQLHAPRAAGSSSSGGGGAWTPPPNRLDEQAARERVMQLASTTAQGAGALEAIQGCLSSMVRKMMMREDTPPTPPSIPSTLRLHRPEPPVIVRVILSTLASSSIFSRF